LKLFPSIEKQISQIAFPASCFFSFRDLGDFPGYLVKILSWLVVSQIFYFHPYLGIYGDMSMLPAVKRSCLPANPCRDDVLRARCPDPNQPLPTLCASYSSQHLLSVNHLQNKGILAILGCDNQTFHFLDPFRFCALLGLPDSQIAVLPSKLSIAFRQIGNAIAVPHALKTLLVVLTTVGSCTLSINETVIECWMQRIKGPSS